MAELNRHRHIAVTMVVDGAFAGRLSDRDVRPRLSVDKDPLVMSRTKASGFGWSITTFD
jgi:hypothetical protein